MAFFLVERYLCHVTADRVAQAGVQVAKAFGPEGTVRYLGSIMVASDDGSLCLFEADPAVDLTAAVTRQGTPFERVVEVALTSLADAAGRATRPSSGPPRLDRMSGAGWQAELRARGYRLTPQRQLVLEAVERLGHATADEVATEVRLTASGVNISTVYRTLELLQELDLVTHTHLGHGPPTYHAAALDDHVHLVCRRCGSIEEVPPATVQDLIDRLAAERGFRVDVGHFAIFGECRSCLEATAAG